ncbi:hypothetical protein FIBSPDRAFT_877055, partial [Athelia psychrophila]
MPTSQLTSVSDSLHPPPSHETPPPITPTPMSQGKQQAVYEEVPVPSSALRIAALAISTALAHAEHPLPAEARTTPLHCSVRGVSGGERKRVSIAEARITRASLVAWDNSTCGLDASTALGYAAPATIATLNQVSARRSTSSTACSSWARALRVLRRRWGRQGVYRGAGVLCAGAADDGGSPDGADGSAR